LNRRTGRGNKKSDNDNEKNGEEDDKNNPQQENSSPFTPKKPSTARVPKTPQNAFNVPRVASMTSAATDQQRRGRFSIGIGGRGGELAPPPLKATSTTARINNTIGKDIWGTRNEKRRIVFKEDEKEKFVEHQQFSIKEKNARQYHHEYSGISGGGDPDVVLLGQ
jgi:hypothetical protein